MSQNTLLHCAGAPWLEAISVQAVFAALTAAGGTARCVGGCVRDHILGVDDAATEVDFATDLTPDAVIAALGDAGIKTVPTGIAHGTVTAIVKAAGFSESFEITTLRADIETDGRHAKVAFTDDWGADAARRDLTINALYCDAAGQVFDPLGAGLADLTARRLCFIGDAPARIAEDYLRVLRFFRFQARLAPDAPADSTALAACAAAVKGLAKLSGERIQAEMFKILALPRADRAIADMRAVGVLTALLGADASPQGVDILVGLCQLDDAAAADPLLRLSGLMQGQPVLVAAALADRWRLSRAAATRLTANAEALNLEASTAPDALRRTLYREGQERVCDALLFMQQAAADPAALAALLAVARAWRKPTFPLTGEMMQAAGLQPGPAMGRVARRVEDWWVAADFSDDPVALAAALAAAIGAEGADDGHDSPGPA